MTTTTGTSISGYLDWLKREIDKKKYGTVEIKFVVRRGVVTKVFTNSGDEEIIELTPLPIDINTNK
jgi:hypothetical protein